jgi:AraC-like DNA-binding protein
MAALGGTEASTGRGRMSVSVFTANNLDDARAAVRSAYYPHRLSPLARQPDLRMSLRSVAFGPVTLGRLEYGAEVSLDFGELDYYHVSIPLSGHVEAISGESLVSTRGQGVVYPPVGHTTIRRWSADCIQHELKIRCGYLETELESMLGRPIRRGPGRFAGVFDVTNGPAASWVQLVRTLASGLNGESSIFCDPLMAGQLAKTIVTGLLLAAPHEYRDELDQTAAPVRPRTVKRAIDVIRAAPEQPFTLPGLAQLVGCSPRSLQEGFRRYVGVSPMTYLRDVRLSGAHNELLACTPTERSVADIAYRWGFQHLGRFAAEYKRHYDESPSCTLRANGV